MSTSNKNSDFLTTRHFFTILLLQNKKTRVKDDLTITPSITYCIEKKTKKNNKMKNKQVQH